MTGIVKSQFSLVAMLITFRRSADRSQDSVGSHTPGQVAKQADARDLKSRVPIRGVRVRFPSWPMKKKLFERMVAGV